MAVDYEGIAALKAEQDARIRAANGGVMPDADPNAAKIEAQLAEINANMSKPKVDVPLDQMIADAKAAQDANDAAAGRVKDPEVVAQEQKTADQLAQIDANRRVQADVPASVDKEGIAAAAKAQQDAEQSKVVTQKNSDQEPTNASGSGAGATKTVTAEDNTPWVTDGGYQAIYAANTDIIKNPDLIYPGQVLKMPGGGTYTVVKGDTLTAIAQGKGKGTYSRTVTSTVPDNVPDRGLVPPAKEPVVRKPFKQKDDWRVRLSLSPNADYLYKASKDASDILYPLKGTDGVIFPYTPSISINYNANYEGTDLTHANYKHYQYRGSEVSNISITATFTAQDTAEANYLLAVIHFFRSVTKMFYGQDSSPVNGTPPPLCYLSGFGAYQFDNHPLAVASFQMVLPDDVDYIRAGQGLTEYTAGDSTVNKETGKGGWKDAIKARLKSSRLNKGGIKDQPKFKSLTNLQATYVPAKMQIVLSCIPIVTRADISNEFSLAKYATGELLRGSKRNGGVSGGGIW